MLSFVLVTLCMAAPAHATENVVDGRYFGAEDRVRALGVPWLRLGNALQEHAARVRSVEPPGPEEAFEAMLDSVQEGSPAKLYLLLPIQYQQDLQELYDLLLGGLEPKLTDSAWRIVWNVTLGLEAHGHKLQPMVPVDWRDVCFVVD